ncbi:NAD-dependent succinate-semialdehyde dehydrogenase [Pseudidiomarina mangrovi]|uniref:NAD-dependent succinate-semialdehyde dehydrogenase n=1 Tax=Pseudidiomarina mangrovi TaxID=2487133 RepID=UPI000FCA40D4|nr:NAD-dependent succinate-semialdehyde dehydrogenase [Pseudidiomarina mangrovi]
MPQHTVRSLLKVDAFIDGNWIPSEQRFSVYNPANGELIAEVCDADPALAERAIDAAYKALGPWQAKTAKERAELMRAWYQAIVANKQALGELMSREQGKPIAEAVGEIEYGASFIDWFAGEAERHHGEVLARSAADKRSWISKQGIGVCTAITPWNFPNAMITRKVAPALAAGCTIVVKPAQLTPLSALALMQLAAEVGIPQGVINMLPSSQAKAIGKVLTEHPRVRKFTFTGSTEVGKQLMAQCSSGMKKVSMELGGNAPFIIFDDADLDLAIEQLLAAKFRNAGQTCISVNRVLVHDSIISEVEQRLLRALAELQVGPGDKEGIDYGPLINQAAIDKAQKLQQQAVDAGAKVLCGGDVLHQLGPLFYAPTLITAVTPTMAISQEEIFAPILALQQFNSEAEALELANATPFGLAGYFCSSDYRRIARVAEQLQCGMLGINAGAISHAYNAFGGVKESGIGVEGSSLGLAEYQVTKTITLGGFE